MSTSSFTLFAGRLFGRGLGMKLPPTPEPIEPMEYSSFFAEAGPQNGLPTLSLSSFLTPTLAGGISTQHRETQYLDSLKSMFAEAEILGLARTCHPIPNHLPLLVDWALMSAFWFGWERHIMPGESIERATDRRISFSDHDGWLQQLYRATMNSLYMAGTGFATTDATKMAESELREQFTAFVDDDASTMDTLDCLAQTVNRAEEFIAERGLFLSVPDHRPIICKHPGTNEDSLSSLDGLTRPWLQLRPRLPEDRTLIHSELPQSLCEVQINATAASEINSSNAHEFEPSDYDDDDLGQSDDDAPTTHSSSTEPTASEYKYQIAVLQSRIDLYEHERVQRALNDRQAYYADRAPKATVYGEDLAATAAHDSEDGLLQRLRGGNARLSAYGALDTFYEPLTSPDSTSEAIKVALDVFARTDRLYTTSSDALSPHDDRALRNQVVSSIKVMLATPTARAAFDVAESPEYNPAILMLEIADLRKKLANVAARNVEMTSTLSAVSKLWNEGVATHRLCLAYANLLPSVFAALAESDSRYKLDIVEAGMPAATRLKAAGYSTVADVALLTTDRLNEVSGIGHVSLKQIQGYFTRTALFSLSSIAYVEFRNAWYPGTALIRLTTYNRGDELRPVWELPSYFGPGALLEKGGYTRYGYFTITHPGDSGPQ